MSAADLGRSVQFQVRDARLAGSIEGNGPPFVWLHALTSSRARERVRGIYDWTEISRSFTVVRFDARGHGESTGLPVEQSYVWRNLGDDLLSVLDGVDDNPVVGGASMGAATTLWAALAAPTCARALVLATPPGAWGALRSQADGWNRAAHVVAKYGAAELTRRTASAPVPELFADRPDLARSAIDVEERLLPAVLRGAAASDLPALDRLAGLKQPTLILAWRGDPDHPVETAQQLAEAIPASRLIVADALSETKQWPGLVREFLIEMYASNGDPT
jgi:3-oxoadipate enol-lactonase